MTRRTDIAWRNLSRERTRLAISVGGVAFAVILIIIIRGLYSGITAQATAYIRSVDADIWVAQSGTPGDFYHSISLMPERTSEALARVDGVRDVQPLIGRPVVFQHDGQDVDLYLLSVDPERPVSGPPRSVSGARVPGRGEILVDQVFADNSGVAVGDTLSIRGRDLTVSGIAGGGNTVMSQFAWTSTEDARALLGAADAVNYFLIRTAEGLEVADVVARIEREVQGVKPLTREEFMTRNTADLREGFLPIVLVLVVIALVIGTAIIGLTIYTATIEKRREYGVLKAIGFSIGSLARVVVRQAMFAAVLGLGSGLLLSEVLRRVLSATTPSFVTQVGVADVAVVTVAALAMSLLAALLPIRPLARLDPAAVFRV